MANILPVSDLRNYNEVLKNCRKGEPVFRKFDSSINQKTLTGPIKPVFFCQF